MITKRLARVGFISIGLAALCSCVSPESTQPQQAPPQVIESTARYRKEYVISPGDRLAVEVRGQETAPRLDGVLVRPDGYITVPVVKDLKAAGKTFPQLDAELTEKLSKRLVNPEVTVSAVALRDAMVYVVGEVVAPKPVPLTQAQTAMQALTWAGGFKPSAEKKAVALIRLTEEGHLRAYKIPVKVDGQPGPYLALQAIPLQADDILLVPQSDIAQFDQIVSEWVNQPLQGVNSVIAPIANYFLIKELN